MKLSYDDCAIIGSNAEWDQILKIAIPDVVSKLFGTIHVFVTQVVEGCYWDTGHSDNCVVVCEDSLGIDGARTIRTKDLPEFVERWCKNKVRYIYDCTATDAKGTTPFEVVVEADEKVQKSSWSVKIVSSDGELFGCLKVLDELSEDYMKE